MIINPPRYQPEKVAMSFAIGKKDSDFEKPQYHIFYDMGAGSTVATLVHFKLSNTTQYGTTKSILDLEVKALGFDSSLGGNSFDVRLQNLLVKKFLDGPGKSYPQVTTNIRAMAKFLKEANRVKQILSANQDTFASVSLFFYLVQMSLKF
jgi:hypoxia up-regulated 1